MGIVRMGPPEWLVDGIAAEFRIGVFVETGTYKGATAAWASKRFQKVFTVENFKPSFDEARSVYGHLGNVKFLHGHSVTVLPDVLYSLEGDAIFWLDAHWMGDGSYGEVDECPIVRELQLLNQFNPTHFIFIDDARLFLSPPPLPHRISQWPTIGELFAELHRKDRYTIIDDDVVISVPGYAKEFVANLVQQKTTSTWSQGANRQSLSVKTLLRKIRK